MSLRCFSYAVFRSHMKPCEIEKRGLPHCSLTNREKSGMDKQEHPGMWMRRILKFVESGAILGS